MCLFVHVFVLVYVCVPVPVFDQISKIMTHFILTQHAPIRSNNAHTHTHKTPPSISLHNSNLIDKQPNKMPKGNSIVGTAAAVGAVVASSMYILKWLQELRDRNRSKSNDLYHLDEETSSTDKQNVPIPDELRSCPYISELELAIRISLEAGANMLDHYESVGTDKQSSISVMTKGSEIDFATEIDIKNEDLVISHIKSKFPEHMIIGEESSAASGQIPELTDEPVSIEMTHVSSR